MIQLLGVYGEFNHFSLPNVILLMELSKEWGVKLIFSHTGRREWRIKAKTHNG